MLFENKPLVNNILVPGWCTNSVAFLLYGFVDDEIIVMLSWEFKNFLLQDNRL